jgi:hemerythrin superfamily protein
MATKPRDVVGLIHAQHTDIARLLGRVSTDTPAERETSWCELRRLIAVHETAEQEVVYPILRSLSDEGQRLADARAAEEAEGIKVLSQLEDLDPTSPEFARLFEDFRPAVAKHSHAEEDEVLPLLLSTQDADRRRRMAETFVMAEQAAPTHAHPHAGTSATAHIVTGPALTIMDHVRDALHQT